MEISLARARSNRCTIVAYFYRTDRTKANCMSSTLYSVRIGTFPKPRA